VDITLSDADRVHEVCDDNKEVWKMFLMPKKTAEGLYSS
jgi:hypothetical protein